MGLTPSQGHYLPPGASSCTCRGLNRIFQKSDSSCICQAGYTSYDHRGLESDQDSNSHGNEDCQPQVRPYSAGQVGTKRGKVSMQEASVPGPCGMLDSYLVLNNENAFLSIGKDFKGINSSILQLWYVCESPVGN